MKYFLPLLFIAISITGFFIYINPQYTKLKESIDTYQKINEANTKASALRAVRGKLTDDKGKISDTDLDKLDRMLPDSVENVGLIIDIDNIAKLNNMRIKGTKIAEASTQTSSASVGPDSQKYGAISLSFTVSTTYDNFLTFLKALEDNNRLVDVTGLSFSASKDDLYDFNVTIQTYWLK
jgi:Tfp pilus assembly protein PilO